MEFSSLEKPLRECERHCLNRSATCASCIIAESCGWYLMTGRDRRCSKMALLAMPILHSSTSSSIATDAHKWRCRNLLSYPAPFFVPGHQAQWQHDRPSSVWNTIRHIIFLCLPHTFLWMSGIIFRIPLVFFSGTLYDSRRPNKTHPEHSPRRMTVTGTNWTTYFKRSHCVPCSNNTNGLLPAWPAACYDPLLCPRVRIRCGGEQISISHFSAPNIGYTFWIMTLEQASLEKKLYVFVQFISERLIYEDVPNFSIPWEKCD